MVHYNLTLIRADSVEQACSKALDFGARHNVEYPNTDGQPVTCRFRGLRDLFVSYEDLEDGAELLFEEDEDVAEDLILASIKPKQRLAVFEHWEEPI